MPKTSFVVLVGTFLVACGGAVDDPAPPLTPGAAVAEPAAPTPAPAPPSAIQETTPPSPPVAEPDVKGMSPADVKAYCASDAAKRPARGAFSEAPPGVDVTATVEALPPKIGTKPRAVLTLRVDFPDERKESEERGLELVESFRFTYLEIESAAGKDAFAVGEHDGAKISGSGGSMACNEKGGQGGSASWGQDAPVKVVITKRTADTIEGTFDGKTFSASLAAPFKALACCL